MAPIRTAIPEKIAIDAAAAIAVAIWFKISPIWEAISLTLTIEMDGNSVGNMLSRRSSIAVSIWMVAATLCGTLASTLGGKTRT